MLTGVEKYYLYKEKFEYTKGPIRNGKSKTNRQYNGEKKRTKGQTMIYKILHRKLTVE